MVACRFAAADNVPDINNLSRLYCVNMLHDTVNVFVESAESSVKVPSIMSPFLDL